MLHKGARTAVVLSLFVFAACGGREPAPSGAGGATAGSGASAGSGGQAGNPGSGGKGGTGTGAAAGSGGAAGATGGSGGTGGATGGSGGTGGATGGGAGKGGSDPDGGGSGPYVTSAQIPRANKLDILLMIDNSSSMADKQEILAKTIPVLVDRFLEPKCIDPVTGKELGTAVNGVCNEGVLAFEPFRDAHFGIITSSLGNHGASGVCEDAIDVSLGRSDPHNNDQGHLITRGPGGTNVPTYQNKGFLKYNPSVAGGLATSGAVAVPFTDMVQGVGQHGCGYEASLEAVYRFLIDPDPYATIRIDTSIGGFGQALLAGTDTQLLQQRRDFLRPDSLVSIILVTDENDCSVVDGGQGFYALLPPVPGTGRSVLKPGTSKCSENPNDKCCTNCGVQAPPPGCPDNAGDPACQKGELLVSEDQPNLRCFDQKRRYGVDFLYPVQRYIDGFTKPSVPNRRGEMVPNPLFSDLTCMPGTGCATPRNKNLIFVTGIVGVPWQDIAVDPIDLLKGYKTARQVDSDGIWADIVGDSQNPAGPVPPRDTHMIESIKPRPGLPGPGSAWRADLKNGHEWDPSKDMAQPNADLQYACIFDLPTPKSCSQGMDCDCFGPNVADMQNPLCQNAQGAYTSTQLRAKAYPGVRVLEMLRGLGDQAVLASLCPANTTDVNREDFGYSPAVRAIIHRVSQSVRTQCFPIALPVDATSGQTPCNVIEAYNATTCNCANEPGRRPAPDSLLTDEMRVAGNCFCEIVQLAGNDRTLCRSLVNPPANIGSGWCYADPAQQMDATCDVVRECAADQQRKVRFSNVNSEPRPGATAYLRCEAQPIAPLPPRCP